MSCTIQHDGIPDVPVAQSFIDVTFTKVPVGATLFAQSAVQLLPEMLSSRSSNRWCIMKKTGEKSPVFLLLIYLVLTVCKPFVFKCGINGRSKSMGVVIKEFLTAIISIYLCLCITTSTRISGATNA